MAEVRDSLQENRDSRGIDPAEISLGEMRRMWDFLNEGDSEKSARRHLLRQMLGKIKTGNGLGSKIQEIRSRRESEFNGDSYSRGCLCQG